MAARPVVCGLAVVVANAGLLVLQLAAGRLLAPFVGSSLETWTAVIGVFLAGIVAGSAAGGRLVRRGFTGLRPVAVTLAAGAAAAGWMVLLPHLLTATGLGRVLPFAARVPVLTLLLAFPAAVLLSVPTPLAVQASVTATTRIGRAAGRVFALGTVGSLAGNYLTGFVLIPTFTVDAIVAGVAGTLAGVAGLVLVVPRSLRERSGAGDGAGLPPVGTVQTARGASGVRLTVRRAAGIVFLASFAGMTVELAAARLLAQSLGVSLYTWTGIIGVILAGTAAGNWAGGRIADRAARRGTGPGTLASFLVAAAVAVAGVLVLSTLVNQIDATHDTFTDLGVVADVLVRTAVLFFAPAFLLGTVSPQVIRLAASGDAAGAVAGRVYAWSAAGAIAGTFATGYALIQFAGVHGTLLGVALLPGVAALLAAPVWRQPLLLGGLSLVGGGAVTGLTLLDSAALGVAAETNYYTIRVIPVAARPPVLALQLDHLDHSWVDPTDPTYLHYDHERTQMEFLRAAGPAARTLVIGGGGYTFPRCARTQLPGCTIDVVEIDPGVTAVAYSHLGLDPHLGIATFNQDGRQFLEEVAAPGAYDLVTLDAVNDFSVPAHLMTRESHRAAKRTLKPGGVYLVSVIDLLEAGRLWRAGVHTLREEFAYVEVLQSFPNSEPAKRNVYVLYAADVPLDLDRLRAANGVGPGAESATRRAPVAIVGRRLAADRVVLTDQYAPVDDLMRPVYGGR